MKRLIFLSMTASLAFSEEMRTENFTLRYVKEFKEVKVAYAKYGRGIVEGKVIYTGERELKNRRKLITKDKEVCGRGYKIDRVYEISEEGGVKNAVVFIEISGETVKEKKTLIQEKCEFFPRVIALTKGSVLEIVNNDEVKHEANGVQDFETIFQISQPKKGMRDRVTLNKPGVVEITCNIHGWMKAWAVVLDTPFYAITDENGNFKISGVPAGTYKLKLWHEGFGEKEMEITVRNGETTRVKFELR